jgi:hypothetical protein
MADKNNRFPKVVTRGSNHAGLWLSLVLGLLILIGQGGSVALAEPITHENIVQRITDAKTPADHEAIAAYYRAEAAAAEAKMKEHEKMKQAYRSIGKSAPYANRHRRYCESLISSNREVKDDYEALAEEHERIAEGLKGSK